MVSLARTDEKTAEVLNNFFSCLFTTEDITVVQDSEPKFYEHDDRGPFCK